MELYETYLNLQSSVDTNINNEKFYVLSTQCIYVFCMDVRTNSDYFTIQY